MSVLKLLHVLLCLLSLGFASPVAQDSTDVLDPKVKRDTPVMSALYKSFLREHSPMAPGARYVFTNTWDLATDPKDDQAIIDTQKILGFNHVSLVVAEVTETKVGDNTQLDIKAVFWDLIISNAKTMAIDVRTAKAYITKPKSQKLTFSKETKKTDKQITTSG
ncbi:hypothetical protein GQ53DRAFT_763366 [Thozetella sp. PMI_491]|nr:hypothetical protein GQ53DRAFT_763366 [Thozetella sp. PMI_491]